MKHRTFKLRRVTAAAVLGMGMTAGVIGVTAGVAGATANSTHKATITATKVQGFPATGTHAAGTIHVVIPATWALTAPTTVGTLDNAYELVATLSNGTWVTAGTTVSGTTAIGITKVTPTTNTLPLEVTTSQTASTQASFTVATKITSAAASGTITVSFKLEKYGASATGPTQQTTTGDYFTGTPAIATTATTNATNTIAASSHPTVSSTGSAQAAGTLTATLHVKSGETSSTLNLKLSQGNTTAAAYVHWGAETVKVTGAVGVGTPTNTTLSIALASATATTTVTVHVTGITYTTNKAEGTIKVTPTWTYSTNLSAGSFTPTYAVNAVSAVATPQGAPTITVTKVSEPSIGVGMTNQLAGNETLKIAGTTGTTKGWTAGGVITLQVKDTSSTACTVSTFTAFDGTPTVTFTSAKSSNLSATPKVTASLTHASTCATTGKTDELKLTFTNTVTIKKTATTAGAAVFTISGIHYSVGATNARGIAKLTGATKTFAVSTPSFTTSGATNAYITWAYVKATSVNASNGAYDHSITPVSLVESKVGTVKKGWVCLTLTTSAGTTSFNTSATPSVKVASGNGTVASTVDYLPASGAKTEVLFHVTAVSSTTKPSTYTLSGLALNAPAATTATVRITATDAGATATTCSTTKVTTTNTAVNTAEVLLTSKTSHQIYGATAAATAVKLLETSFTVTGGHCPGATVGASIRPVIIATETHFQDALSAQYLASDLHTGVLLTSYGSVPSVTIQALKTEGVTQVDIVGGPLAVSTAVQKQLEALPAYACGGTSELTTNGHVRTITVTRIYGQTAEGTAQAIDSLVPSTHVATEAFVTAYVGVNANKGTGMYNTTGGLSSAPTTSAAVPTVIMASGTEFQDAMAASTLSYWRHTGKSLPIVLTSPTSLTANAAGALATTGAKQVILMGGTLAVTNSVVTTLVSDGIEVLRIAGQNYTGTAAELAKFEYATAPKGLDWENSTVAVARGNGFTDGLVGAVVAGNTSADYYTTTTTPEPLVLTLNPTTVGTTLTAFLKAYGATGPTATKGNITSLQIFGGPLAVSPAVISQMQSDIA